MLETIIYNTYFLWFIIVTALILLAALEINRRQDKEIVRNSYKMVADAKNDQAQAEGVATQWYDQCQEHLATIAALEQSESDQLSYLRGQLNNANQQIPTLEQENKQLNTNVSSLSKQLAADAKRYRTQVDSLTGQLDKAKQDKKQSTVSLNQLQSTHDQLQVAHKQALATHDQLQAQVISITSKYDQLQIDHDHIVTERDSLLTERDNRLTKANNSKKTRKKSTRRNYAILIPQYLADHPDASKIAVARALGCSPNTVKSHWPESEAEGDQSPELQLAAAGAD